MPSLKDIKKRIGSVKNTRQITKAMKMVSAAKLRRAQEAAVSARPYAQKLADVVSNLAKRGGCEQGNNLLDARGKSRALLVAVTSDRGLCGAFNANINKGAERWVRENPEGYAAIDLMVIGRKGRDYLSRRDVNIIKTYEHLTGNLTYKTASLLGEELVGLFEAGTYDGIHIIYNAFQSAISQEVTTAQMLPILPPQMDERVGTAVDYLYEPERCSLLDEICAKQVEVQIFTALLESVASEHGARMSAMDSASRNASEMIRKLTLQYNRARQAAITKELMEIISGSESIK